MTLINRWRQTALHNKILTICALASAFLSTAAWATSYRQATISQRHAEMDLQPWINVEQLALQFLPPSGNIPVVKISCHNPGKIPAANVHIAGIIALDHAPAIPREETDDFVTATTSLSLGPGASYEFSFFGQHSLTPAEAAAVKAGSRLTYFAGHIYYRDGSDHQHSVQVNAVLKKADAGSGRMTMLGWGNRSH